MKPCLSPDPLEEPPPAGQQSSCKFQEQREKNKVHGIDLVKDVYYNTICCDGEGGNVGSEAVPMLGPFRSAVLL